MTFRSKLVATLCFFMTGISCAQSDHAARLHTVSDQVWWKHAVIYEIYPRSFQDSNGDGIGDLNGVTQRLDYLKKLGVDAVWLSPMFPSPQVDFGYDISNYEGIDPQYGTLADFDRLLAEAKKRDIRIILDMVLNHTSDKHPWFEQSAASKSNPKSDWFVWNDGKAANSPGVTDFEKKYEHEGKVPPNNWISLFGGSAWEWSPARHQFYYHKFYRQQPDLNWRNPAVEKAIFDTMRFWLDRGVAGFRLDAVPTLFEDPANRDEPETGGTDAYGDPAVDSNYTDNLPEVHDVMRRMRAMVDSFPGNRVVIGETYLPNTAELDKWYGGEAKDELQLPMDMLVGFNGAKLDAAYFRKYLDEVQTQVHGSQPLLVFDNHDNRRSIDRFTDGTNGQPIARQIATMLLTARGSALMYYGEELGMTTSTPTRVEDVKDPIGVLGWPKEKGRDGERTPMQWDGTAQAGFSTVSSTWLPLAANAGTVNVKAEQADPHSLLNWHEKLIALRRSVPALHDGGMRMLAQDSASVLAYVRPAMGSGRDVVVAMNMSATPQTVALNLPGKSAGSGKIHVLLTDAPALQNGVSLESVQLPPYSSWIAEVEK